MLFLVFWLQQFHSGNVTKENIGRLTALGVDYISSGALTHSAPILDISMKNLHAVE